MSSKQSGQRRVRGGRGRGGHASSNNVPQPSPATNIPPPTPPPVTPPVPQEKEDASEDVSEVCYICANPVVYYSLGPCNHRTCHICALRLRALYKNNKCAFCKEEQQTVIFTSSPHTLFSDYSPNDIPFKDAKLGIHFETEQMLQETLILLRFNCPDDSCDYVASGWGDVGLHVRSVHGRVLCDLCISHKKVFAHEHTLYTPQQLSVHLPEGGNRRGQKNTRPPREGDNLEGDLPHPPCLFCHRCFFGSDELFKHMREIHEDCFLCKRDHGSSEYFLDYPSLEKHFNTAHFPCTHPTCQSAKFVVFSSHLDLRAHVVNEHTGDMSAAGIRDARRIEVDFQEVNRGNRGRGRGNQADRGGGPSGRDPPAPRTVGGGGSNRRREAFGASLTTDEAPSNPVQPTPQPTFVNPSTPNRNSDIDPAVLTRHTSFLNLVASKANRPNTAVPSIQSAIRGWKTGESSTRNLISMIHTVMDENLEKMASIVNAFLGLLDDDDADDAEDRRRDLLKEWRSFSIEQKRQFPSLVETSVAASKGDSGGYAAVTGGRAILNAKHHTSSPNRKKGNIWDRVEQAASSSGSFRPSTSTPTRSAMPAVSRADRFPPLGAVGPSSTSSGSKSTPWTSSSATKPAPNLTRPTLPSKQTQVPKLTSKELFPSLSPSPAASSREVPKVSGNISLKNILGTGPAPQNQWGASPSSTPEPPPPNPNTLPQNRGGKKGKGKQTLFTLGTFPA